MNDRVDPCLVKPYFLAFLSSERLQFPLLGDCTADLSYASQDIFSTNLNVINSLLRHCTEAQIP